MGVIAVGIFSPLLHTFFNGFIIRNKKQSISPVPIFCDLNFAAILWNVMDEYDLNPI
jgi:hypothetical protein